MPSNQTKLNLNKIHVFTFTLSAHVLLFFVFTFVYLLVPCTVPVNKFTLVFPNLSFMWQFYVRSFFVLWLRGTKSTPSHLQ